MIYFLAYVLVNKVEGGPPLTVRDTLHNNPRKVYLLLNVSKNALNPSTN